MRMNHVWPKAQARMLVRLRRILCASLLCPGAACAQYAIRGVVRDSLSGTVLSGASVHVVPADTPWSPGIMAMADSTGQYHFADVHGGRYRIGFVHPRLDSLGFDAVVQTIDVAGADSVLVRDLALPAAPTLLRSICGALSAKAGLLFGKVLRADGGRPVSAGRIVAEWRELALEKVPREWQTESVVARVAEDGRFTLCGVPTDAGFRAHAETIAPPNDVAAHHESPTAGSGTIDIEFGETDVVLHRDFVVTPTLSGNRLNAGVAAGTSVLYGRVLDDDGRPVVAARIVVRESAALDTIAITDSTGQYRLGALHGGTYTIEIDKIGMQSRRSAFDLLDGSSRRMDFSVRRVAQALPGVTVTAQSTMEQAGFDYRRTHRNGFFRTGDDIAREGAISTTFVLLSAPMLMQWGSNRSGRPILTGPLRCTPLLFIDGRLTTDTPWGKGNKLVPDTTEAIFDLDSVVPTMAVGGIEVYAPGEAPARFKNPFGVDSCSSVVVWTKGTINAR